MHHHALSLRRTFWVACACILLLPRLATALPSRAFDLDGDGQIDRFTLDRHDTSLLSVWLSGSNTVQTIRSRVPLEAVVVADIDGDRQPELVARDSKSQLHVWTRRHKGFRPYRAHHVIPEAIGQRSRRAIDGGDPDSSDVITDASFVPCALTPHWSPRAFRVKAIVARALPLPPSPVTPLAEPVAPRPPPAVTLR